MVCRDTSYRVPALFSGDSILAGKFDYKDEFLYLTTRGRKTGLPREIEIWYVVHDGCYYLCSEKRYQADWVQNILHEPGVTFWVEGQTYQGIGSVVDPENEPETMAELNALFDLKYQWSDGLMVRLCPNTA